MRRFGLALDGCVKPAARYRWDVARRDRAGADTTSGWDDDVNPDEEKRRHMRRERFAICD